MIKPEDAWKFGPPAATFTFLAVWAVVANHEALASLIGGAATLTAGMLAWHSMEPAREQAKQAKRQTDALLSASDWSRVSTLAQLKSEYSLLHDNLIVTTVKASSGPSEKAFERCFEVVIKCLDTLDQYEPHIAEPEIREKRWALREALMVLLEHIKPQNEVAISERARALEGMLDRTGEALRVFEQTIDFRCRHLRDRIAARELT